MMPLEAYTDIQLVRWPNNLSISLSIMSPGFSAAEVVAMVILNHESVLRPQHAEREYFISREQLFAKTVSREHTLHESKQHGLGYTISTCCNVL